jgi:hypothetical protein
MRSQSTLFQLLLWCGVAAVMLPTSAEPKPTPSDTAGTFRLASTAKPSKCRASDVALDQLRSRHHGGYVFIVGRVMNNCNAEAGVQIKIAILDHAGGVLHVTNFWPASTENIPAHSGFPFQTEIAVAAAFDRFQVSIIDVKRWTE